MSQIAISAENLSKSFRVRQERRTSFKERLVRGKAPEPEQFWALRNASFEVPRGGSLGLIGHNGSGKSTALKVLAGIYRPTSGHVTINGSVSALLEVGAGFHPELTGRENIRLNATILGFSNKEINRMMDQIIEFADIGDHIDGPIKHYSSGMYVRLGFAVAVMVRPDILIVDEVIAVGDEEFQRKCYEYLYDLRRNNTTIVLVSHGLGNIIDLCDEAILLDHGDVVAQGPSAKIVRTYLDAVNEREIARAQAEREAAERDAVEPETPDAAEQPAETAADLSDSPTDGVDRRGSGGLRFTEVVVLDEQGNNTGVLVAGRPATIRMTFFVRRPISNLVIGMAISDHKDAVVTGMNNRHVGTWDVESGTGQIYFQCDPLLLASGSYKLRLGALEGSHTLDAVDAGIPFVVRPPDVETAGAYVQPGTWEMKLGEPEVQAADSAVEILVPEVATL